MPSSTTSPVEWTNRAGLIQGLPPELKSTLDGTKKIVDDIDKAIKVATDILNLASGLISGGSNILIGLIEGLVNNAVVALEDIIALGGGAIIITPFNRAQPRKMSLLPPPYPLMVPVMTTEEVLKEFTNSFSNTKDPYRPTWSDNDKVTGWGFLVSAGDPSSLCAMGAALNLLFTFKEFSDMSSVYSTSIGNWANDMKRETDPTTYLSSFYKDSVVSFDVNAFLNNMTSNVVTQAKNGEILPGNISAVDSTFKGTLHWYGLSLSMFTWFKDTINLISDLTKKLVGLIQIADSAIASLIKAITKKLNELKNLIDLVYATVSGFLVSLTSGTVLFTFSVPEGTGGVKYITDSISNSINYPQNDVARAINSTKTSNKFTMLAFFGYSSGVNTDAWAKMFGTTTSTTQEEFDKLTDMLYPKYTILPRTDGLTFKFGQEIKVTVVSVDSTSINPIYFAYELRDNGGNVMASWKNTATDFHNWAVANVSSFSNILTPSNSVDLTKPVNVTYKLWVQVYDSLGIVIGTHTSSLVITDILSYVPIVPPPAITDDTPYSDSFLSPLVAIVDDKHPTIIISTITPTYKHYTSGVTAQLKNKGENGGSLETIYVSANSSGNIGTSITATSKPQQLIITDSTKTSMTWDVINNKGKPITSFTSYPIPETIKFLKYPATMFFNFGFNVTSMRICYGNPPICRTISLPGFFDVNGGTLYTYWLLVDGVWMGPFTFSTVTTAIEGTKICG